MIRKKRHRPLLAGRSLCGFWGLFEADFGDPQTPLPLATITPSRVGAALLPFRCPNCQEVLQELACPTRREKYRDPRSGTYHCTSCGLRFFLNREGIPLSSNLPAGAEVGPSRVERAGKVFWQDQETIVGKGLDAILGILFVPAPNGYRVLAKRG